MVLDHADGSRTDTAVPAQSVTSKMTRSVIHRTEDECPVRSAYIDALRYQRLLESRKPYSAYSEIEIALARKYEGS